MTLDVEGVVDGGVASCCFIFIAAADYNCIRSQWHWFAINGDDDRRLFAFPGIWQRWNGPVKKDGANIELGVYAFMTTAPNALTDSINHGRMPVLLSEEQDFETWLTGTP